MNCDVAVSVKNTLFGVLFSDDFVKEVKKLNEKRLVSRLFVQRRNGNLMYYAWGFCNNREKVSVYACFNGVMLQHDEIIELSNAIFSIKGNGKLLLKETEKLLLSNHVVCDKLPPIDYGGLKPDVFVNYSFGIAQISSYAQYSSRIAIIFKPNDPDRFVPLIFVLGVILIVVAIIIVFS